MPDQAEFLEVVSPEGTVLRLAGRSELHGDPSLLHRVVHLLVFNSKGELLLQKRSMNKDVAPGMWDTSVGGHINPGEDVRQAAEREMQEELGIQCPSISFLYQYIFSNHRESELVSTFFCTHEGPFSVNEDEIDEVRFWDIGAVRENLGKKIFSNHFECEIIRYLSNDSKT